MIEWYCRTSKVNPHYEMYYDGYVDGEVVYMFKMEFEDNIFVLNEYVKIAYYNYSDFEKIGGKERMKTYNKNITGCFDLAVKDFIIINRKRKIKKLLNMW